MTSRPTGGFTLTQLDAKHKGGLEPRYIKALVQEHGRKLEMAGVIPKSTDPITYQFTDGQALIFPDRSHVQIQLY